MPMKEHIPAKASFKYRKKNNRLYKNINSWHFLAFSIFFFRYFSAGSQDFLEKLVWAMNVPEREKVRKKPNFNSTFKTLVVVAFWQTKRNVAFSL